VLSLPITIVVYGLVSGGIIVALMESEARAPTPDAALEAAQKRLGDLFGASVRSFVIVALFCLTIIGIPFGLYRAIRWALYVQAIMIDGQTGGSSLAYSARIVQGRWWSTLGRIIAASLVGVVPITLIGQLIQAAVPGLPGALIGAIVSALTTPYAVIASTLIYFDLKSRVVAVNTSTTA